jgi:EAL domain-containing protein (putative c-di-GMP-specific phosphodiesterase class I)
MTDSRKCDLCADRAGTRFDREITMAFQPIVDIQERRIFAQEALVRGTDGAGAGEILSAVTEENRYHFDQTCRVTAIALAARLGIDSVLSLNFLPNAVYEPANCIRKTLQAADEFGFDCGRIMFELTEQEAVRDIAHLKRIFEEYRGRGFVTAIDDFGAGFAGLGLLADLQPDYIKIDRALISGIDEDSVRRAIVTGIVGTARALDIGIIAEGIETEGELRVIRDLGIVLVQGFRISKPVFEGITSLGDIDWPLRRAA